MAWEAAAEERRQQAARKQQPPAAQKRAQSQSQPPMPKGFVFPKGLKPALAAAAAEDGVQAALRRGDVEAARQVLDAARALPAGTVTTIAELEVLVETLPAAAVQVLKHGLQNPCAALGIERSATLVAPSKREWLLRYRKLALELHPDKSSHPLAVEAMQTLNVAYDKVQKGVGGGGGPPSGHVRPQRSAPRAQKARKPGQGRANENAPRNR